MEFPNSDSSLSFPPTDEGGKRVRDDLGSTNVIIKRLSISSALPPSQSDDLYDEKENEELASSTCPYSGDDDDFSAPIAYDADNENDRGTDCPDGKVVRSIRVRNEFDQSSSTIIPSSPSFVFHGSRNRGDGGSFEGHPDGDNNEQNDYDVNRSMNEEKNAGADSSSDSDSSYMLPRVKGLFTSKMVRGRNPVSRVDLLIDDVIKKSARRSRGNISLLFFCLW